MVLQFWSFFDVGSSSQVHHTSSSPRNKRSLQRQGPSALVSLHHNLIFLDLTAPLASYHTPTRCLAGPPLFLRRALSIILSFRSLDPHTSRSFASSTPCEHSLILERYLNKRKRGKKEKKGEKGGVKVGKKRKRKKEEKGGKRGVKKKKRERKMRQRKENPTVSLPTLPSSTKTHILLLRP